MIDHRNSIYLKLQEFCSNMRVVVFLTTNHKLLVALVTAFIVHLSDDTE